MNREHLAKCAVKNGLKLLYAVLLACFECAKMVHWFVGPFDRDDAANKSREASHILEQISLEERCKLPVQSSGRRLRKNG